MVLITDGIGGAPCSHSVLNENRLTQDIIEDIAIFSVVVNFDSFSSETTECISDAQFTVRDVNSLDVIINNLVEDICLH